MGPPINNYNLEEFLIEANSNQKNYAFLNAIMCFQQGIQRGSMVDNFRYKLIELCTSMITFITIQSILHVHFKINKDDVKPISFKETDPFRKISIFKNIKYKWGGKSFKGIDCSALIQVFLNFNNKFCPRDAKDQVKFFKKNVKLKKLKKNDIIYWKGHVALALTSKKLIHAYGPMKKTVVMGVNETIERIEQTARLKVIGIRRL